MAVWRNRMDCVQLLLDRGADVRIRDYGDNAYALHFAAEAADLAIVRLLVEAGAEVNGEGDDHQVGVLGWATCLGKGREDVAADLLSAGAGLTIWRAIALAGAEEVRALVRRDPSLLAARSSHNDHHRTVLHHAAAVNRPAMVRLLLELGASAEATDATGATALTIAAVEHADPSIVAMLERAGAKLDLLGALTLRRYDLAERMVADDPARIGPDGRDTIAVHLLVAKGDIDGVRWLIEHGADLNAKRVLWDCNHTALHITAERGAPDLARVLLDAGADPDVLDDKYQATVLGWAEYCGQPEVAALLRARGVTA